MTNSSAQNSPPPLPPEPFISLSRHARALGISSLVAAQLRDEFLEANVHYPSTDSSQLTPAGATRLCELLKVPEKTDPTPPTPATPSLIVFRSAPQIRNARLVETRLATDDPFEPKKLILLWVRDNKAFRPKMIIPEDAIKPHDTRAGEWQYVSRRTPK